MSQSRLGVRARISATVVVATLAGALSACGEAPPEANAIDLQPAAIARQALAPTNSLPASQTTNEDTRLTFVAGENGLVVSDADNSQTQVQITVTNGTFTAVPQRDVTITGNGTPDVILTGPIEGPYGVNASLSNSFYQPAVNFNGSAQLQMNSQDTGGEIDLDVMAITVTAFNDPPTITIPTGTQRATEDTPFALSVTANDVDLEGEAIQVTLSSTNGTLMTLPGTTGLTFSVGSGTNVANMTFQGLLPDVNSALNGLTITAEPNYVGASSVSIALDDLGNNGAGDPGVDLETLNINWGAVNDAPVNTVPGGQNIDEDTSFTFSSGAGSALSVNDIDGPTTLLQVSLSATGGTLDLGTTSGITLVSGDGDADASVVFTGTLSQLNTALEGTVFTPNADFAGTAVVTMTSNDLGNSGVGGAKQDSDSVSVVVAGINDAPVNTVPGSQFASEDVILSFTSTSLISIADVDATLLQVTLSATNGTLTLPRKNGLVFQVGDGTSDASMTFTGGVAAINTAINGLQFLSTANYSGDATVTVATSDLGASGSGGTLTDSDEIGISVAPVNDAPSATNDAITISEDGPTSSISPLQNDTFAPDVDEVLTLASVSTPTYGTVTTSGTQLLYTAAANFNGVDTFSYTISDGVLTDTATVTVNVTAVNDAPTATPDSFTVSQATATTLGLVSNDSAAPDTSETLTITQVTQPANAVVTINADGNSVRYSPNSTFVGNDSFTYTISDGALTATALVDVVITAVNTRPQNTLPAPQTTSEDIPLTFSSGDGNSITVADENNASLTASILVTNGTFTLGSVTGLTSVNGNGTSSVTAQGDIGLLNTAFENARYTPAANFHGSPTLTLTTSDTNGESDEDTLTLTVTPINDPPVNTAPTAVQAATEDAAKTFSTLSVSDIDLGPGEIRVSLSADNGTVVTLATTSALTLETGDGVGDALVTFTGLLGNVNAALNGLTLSPPENFIGNSTLTLTANDLGNVGAGGEKIDSDIVSVKWNAANDAPVNILPPAQSTDEDVSLTFSEDNANAIRISDADAGGALVQVTLSVTNGTLTLGDATGLDFTAGDGVDDVSMTVLASLAQLNGNVDAAGALDGLVFTPAPGFAGSATLTVVTNDQGNTGGAAKTDTDAVSITVTAVNDAPVNTVPGQQAAQEDAVLFFSSATGNVIAVSDSDATSLQVSLSVSSGALALSTVTGLVFQAGDGVNDANMTFRGAAGAINNALNGLRYTPLADFSGPVSLSVHSDDLGGTGIGGARTDDDAVEILVSAVNDPPVAVNDAYTVDEDAAPTSLAVLLNDSALPDTTDVLTITSLTAPNRGGTATIDGDTISYQPLANFNGTERFDYTISDGGITATGRVTVTINSINDLPVAVDDALSIPRNANALVLAVLANDSDADADGTLQITATTTPTHGTLTLDGTGTELRYTGVPGYAGPDTFEYTISDGVASDSAIVSLTIEEGENAVPAAAADAVTVSEDSDGFAIDVLANDQGITDGPIVVAIVTEPTHGTLQLEADNRARYVPNVDFNGTDSFRYQITDADGETSSADAVITVTPTNDVPVASADQATTPEDTSVNVNVLANDRGLGDGSITVTVTTESTFGTAVVESDNSITFQPGAEFFGQAFIVYSVSDGEDSASGAVTIVVTPVADAPVALADTAATRAGDAVDIDVLANDSDADGEALLITAVSEPANGTASIVDGKVHYLPADGFEGTDEVEYTIDDGTGLTDVGVIAVGVGLDADEDGLIDLDELDLGTDPADADTDDDLIADGLEGSTTATDPLDDDSDDDGLLDGNEDADQDGAVGEGETDPNDFDTDGDGLSDGVESGLAEPQGTGSDEEVFVADADPSSTSDPTSADSDGDGLRDGEEDKNGNGRVEPGELDPSADDAPAPPPPPEDEGGCSAVTEDSALASLALLALLWRLRRRRERTTAA